MRDDNVVEGRVGAPKARQSDLDHHLQTMRRKGPLRVSVVMFLLSVDRWCFAQAMSLEILDPLCVAAALPALANQWRQHASESAASSTPTRGRQLQRVTSVKSSGRCG